MFLLLELLSGPPKHLNFSKKIPGGFAPLTPHRGSAPGPRWGLRPQTPAVRRPSARHASRASLAKASLRSAISPAQCDRHFSSKKHRLQALFHFLQAWYTVQYTVQTTVHGTVHGTVHSNTVHTYKTSATAARWQKQRI